MSEPIEPWQLLDSTYAFRDRWLSVRSDTVRLPNGKTLSPYHVVEVTDWVNVVAITTDRRLVLVRQFRAGSGRDSLETPGGLLNPGEDPLAAGARELLEETGYAGSPPRWLGRPPLTSPRAPISLPRCSPRP